MISFSINHWCEKLGFGISKYYNACVFSDERESTSARIVVQYTVLSIVWSEFGFKDKQAISSARAGFDDLILRSSH